MCFLNIILVSSLIHVCMCFGFTNDNNFEFQISECCKFRQKSVKFEDFPEYPKAKLFKPYISKTIVIHNNNEKLFTSACVQCLLCQTIAREFNSKITEFYQNSQKPYTILYDSTKLNKTLDEFCDNSFENFDLRENKGLRFIDKISKKSEHVYCRVEGLWPLKLKEMCNEFMKFGNFEIYKRWVKNTHSKHFDEIDLFCRSYGIFQYCRNLDISPNLEQHWFY